MEQLSKHDELKKKITGIDSDDSDDDRDVDEQLDELEDEIEETQVPRTGVFGMKFMQRAFEKQKEGVLSDITRMRDEFEGVSSESEEEQSVEPVKEKKKKYRKEDPELEKRYMEQMEALKYDGVREEGQVGYRADVQGGKVVVGELKDKSYVAKQYDQEESSGEMNEYSQSEGEEDGDLDMEEERQEPVQEVVESDTENANPWLLVTSSKPVKKSKKQSTSVSRLQAARFGKSLSKLQKDRKEILTEKERREEEAKILIKKPIEPKKVEIESEDDSDVEQPQKVELVPIKKFTKKQVLAMVFENDQLAADFEEEVAKSEKPEEDSNGLPGWGSWSNKKSSPKKEEKILEKEVPKERKLVQVAPSIPSKKYMADAVPHQFENKAQFERFNRMPLGKSWMPQSVFKKAIQPRVKVRPGQVVEAMSWKK